MPAVPEIPPLFLQRMANWLGEDFPAFQAALSAPPRAGLRVNTLKLSPEAFVRQAPFALGERIPWCPSAFLLEGEEKPGRHPYHLAGLYYLQDPSAMAPAELLFSIPMREGERVLDLSAAPGGKTTHLAALMGGRGLLVANEIKDKRVGHLVQNVERWGAGNVMVTNESPERLADHFGAGFDRVLVDAPCSGEGMFRKDMGARLDWSPEMVMGCAVRQRNILRVAACLVKPGGYLLYSTCTFAPEENEGVLARFLEAFPHFRVLELPLFAGFAHGKPEWLEGGDLRLRGAVRLFPHRLAGEGHFVCLLQREADGEADSKTDDKTDSGLKRSGRMAKWTGKKPMRRNIEPTALRLWQTFARETLDVDWDEDRLYTFGERLYYLPEEFPDVGRLRVVHPGVWLGTLKRDRFEPAHPLALFLKPGQIKRQVSFPASSAEIAAYLRGESLPCAEQGWVAVCADGWPLGWGKGVQGTLKNHFPRGWM